MGTRWILDFDLGLFRGLFLWLRLVWLAMLALLAKQTLLALLALLVKSNLIKRFKSFVRIRASQRARTDAPVQIFLYPPVYTISPFCPGLHGYMRLVRTYGICPLADSVRYRHHVPDLPRGAQGAPTSRTCPLSDDMAHMSDLCASRAAGVARVRQVRFILYI